jgi:hypothetical protein
MPTGKLSMIRQSNHKKLFVMLSRSQLKLVLGDDHLVDPQRPEMISHVDREVVEEVVAEERAEEAHDTSRTDHPDKILTEDRLLCRPHHLLALNQKLKLPRKMAGALFRSQRRITAGVIRHLVLSLLR